MKKIVSLFLLLIVGATLSFAQTKESTSSAQKKESIKTSDRKAVTSKWSLVTGTAQYASHYLSPQEYSGVIWGIEAIHGRFYKKSDNVSWKLRLNHLRKMHSNIGGGGLENPAKTAHASVQAYEVDYATHYNWLFFNHLQVRVGGSLNIYGDYMQNHEHAINNVMTINLQTQLYALAEVRYGMDFKRFGIDIYANIGTPFIGFSSFDDRYEPFITSVVPGEINVNAYNHFKFTSFHNMQGLNFEIGVDFALRDLTLSFSYEERDRWWNGFELQNYRKNSLLKVGISVNLLGNQPKKSRDRQF